MPWYKCSDDSGACCTATMGFWSSKTWFFLTLILCMGFGIVAIVVPIFIDELVDDAICTSLCVPTRDDPVWMYDNWRTSDNETVNPPMYAQFYIYNITNIADMVELGANATLTINGPYTYQMRTEKFDVEFSPDNSMVYFNEATAYIFVPEMSNGSESDTYWNVNLPYLSGDWLFYYTKGHPGNTSQKDLCYLTNVTKPNQACLFGRRNVTEMIFNQKSLDIQLSNQLYFPNRPLNDRFQLYFNCTVGDNTQCFNLYNSEQNFGLGGICDPVYPNPDAGDHQKINATFCKDPASTPGTDIRSYMHTAQDHYFDKLGVYKAWMGNESIWFWNATYNATTGQPERLETARGLHDEYQFNIHLKKTDNLSIWDEESLRHINLTYMYEHYAHNVKLWRYTPSSDLYAGTDPFYWGGQGYAGFLNVSTPSLIVHGGYAPILISNAFGAGVSDQFKNYNCLNCPNVDGLSSQNITEMYGSYLDIQPTLGKTLCGATRIQYHVQIGQDYIFGNPKSRTFEFPYKLVPETLMPFLVYNMTVCFNETQAKLVRDGLDELDLAYVMHDFILGLGISLCVIFFFLAIYSLHKWRKHKEIAESGLHDSAYKPLN